MRLAADNVDAVKCAEHGKGVDEAAIKYLRANIDHPCVCTNHDCISRSVAQCCLSRMSCNTAESVVKVVNFGNRLAVRNHKIGGRDVVEAVFVYCECLVVRSYSSEALCYLEHIGRR
ncbi:uncharacterized protein VICG_01573 [Vittaforma corneae ATCC 50505]|uniref:Uncharacterized protein n=1 Tax=Vittaforma corneae (strain ATCC 50505) TaxID=993615 RepID=L2GKC6_VITCO|nr:uncharacterized protein VICG_01573 [Vittaforma corneae ATCC 50505]ELA41333.1 hypothetical protein VICG_01573 [Vittaforma corneae ATCC 50505]